MKKLTTSIGNKENNFYANLRECTHKENCNFESTKKRMSEAAKSKIWTKEHREKISDSLRGRIWVTNGTNLKLVNPNEIPNGYKKGRTIK